MSNSESNTSAFQSTENVQPTNQPTKHLVPENHELLAALESGDFQTALQLLPKDSPSPPTVGPDNLTPLHYACQHGRADIALLLITEYNYSINSRSKAGQTPLHFAAKYGQLLQLVVLLLLQQTSGKQSSEVGTHSKQPLLPKVSLSAGDNNGNTLLHLAATHGHLHLTKYLIHDAHCNPASTNNEKQTPLHLAAMHGHLEVVQYLVEEEGCDPSARDEYGRTPLYLAAGSGQLEVVKYLITEKQCDPNCKTTKCKKETERSREIIRCKFASGRTPLHAASQGGHLGVVQYLIDELSCSPSCTDDDGRTPLYVASRDGQITVVKFLTDEKHCDPLCKTDFSNTPLQAAALGGSLEVVKFFVSEKGCDPMCRGRWGRTPLHGASQEGHLEIVKYLIDEQHVDPSCLDVEFRVTPLRLASEYGRLAVVKFLTEEKKCDPLHKDKYGNTPLHGAALGGSLEVVKFFISEKGCDPMCRGRWGRTPLHYASERGHLEIVKYLIDVQHVDPSCLDNKFRHPLTLASKNGHMAVVKFLTDKKHCDPLHQDKLGNTPLHGAIQGYCQEAVKFLINVMGFNPMHSDPRDGVTLLHIASFGMGSWMTNFLNTSVGGQPAFPTHLTSSEGQLAIVQFLTEEKHCNPHCKDKLGKTPLHWAALGGSLEVVKFFISEKGCEPMCRDQWGRTPLHVASEKGHLEIVKYLIDEQHINPSCLDVEFRVTPLRLASNNGHLAVVKFLTEEKKCDPLHKDKYGNTPLHGAAFGGSLEVVKFFISEKGCDPMCRGQWGRTSLHFASEKGHLVIVKYLIDEQHVNPSCLDVEFRLTPLRRASENGHLAVVKFLTEEKKCDPLHKDKYGNTPLHGAAFGGSLEVVKFFISEKGCDPMCRGQWGRTPLHVASQKGYLATVKYLIDEQHVNPSCLDEKNMTPLCLASRSGHIAVVKFLTEEKQCGPLHKDEDGNTPLHGAAFGGSLEVVKFFISEKGCDPMCRGQWGRTPLHVASQKGHLATVKYLIDEQHVNPSCLDEKNMTPLCLASRSGHIAVVKFFTEEKQCDPLHKDKDGNTPLHGAALGGSLEVVKFFINEKGCDSMCENQWGMTPLMLSIAINNIEIAKYLIDKQHTYPSNPDDSDTTLLRIRNLQSAKEFEKLMIDMATLMSQNSNPFLLAALLGNLEFMKFLINEKGCDPTCRGLCGLTPLHVASLGIFGSLMMNLASDKFPCKSSTEESLAVVKFLTEEKHCNPQCKDEFGYTPLHCAALGGNLEVVKFFINEKGCDPMCRDLRGLTPLHVASLGIGSHILNLTSDKFPCKSSTEGSLAVVKFLAEEKHCNPQCKNKSRYTPLHYAALGGNLEVVKFFINEKGCDPMFRGQGGNTPLHCATMFNSVLGMVSNFIMSRRQQTAVSLQLSFTQRPIAVVKFLIEEMHCDPQCRNSSDDTPLHLAAQEGSLEVVKFFISEKGCDPMCRGEQGKTPLHYASKEGHLKLVQYLIDELHVDHSCLDQEEATPLHMAAASGHLEVVKYLVGLKHCNPVPPSSRMKTPLDLAYEGNHKEVCLYLISKGANLSGDKYFQIDPEEPWPPLKLSVKIYVVGIFAAGKSTLIKSLQDEPFLSASDKASRRRRGRRGRRRGQRRRERRREKPLPLLRPQEKGKGGEEEGGDGEEGGKWEGGLMDEAFQDEPSISPGAVLNVADVRPGIVGIIPTEFDSGIFGKVTIYDFAGHESFHAGHEAIFENTNRAVVLALIDLNMPLEDIMKAIGYWRFLIANAVSTSGFHVSLIPVGSHADLLTPEELKAKVEILSKSLRSFPHVQQLEITGGVILDCRESVSSGMLDLRNSIKLSCQRIRLQTDFDYHNGRILNAFINKYLSSILVCTFGELLSHVLSDPNPDLKPLRSPQALYQVCEDLNTSGHLILMKNNERPLPEESWIILNKEAILSKVHGLLGHNQEFNKSGIVPLSQLKCAMKHSVVNLCTDLMIRYMVRMQFCMEIEPHVLRLIEDPSLSQVKEKCFFFPSVISENIPADMWKSGQCHSYYFGWGLKCTKPSHFFTPRFLQVLLIRLASRFALNPHLESPGLLEPAQGCRLWKNGIHWRDGWGIEAIVEITHQSTVLNMMLRGLKGSEMKLIHLRSSIIQQILHAKAHICPTIYLEEYLIHPKCLQTYPMGEVCEIPLSNIAEAIVRKEPYLKDSSIFSDSHGIISVKELLHFEPYQDLNVKLLQQIFDEESADKLIPHNALSVIAIALQSKWKTFSELLHVSNSEIVKMEMDGSMNEAKKCLHILNVWSGEDGTYGTLRCVLDQYSICAGNNLLKLCTVETVHKELTQYAKDGSATTATSGTQQPKTSGSIVSSPTSVPDKLDDRPKISQLWMMKTPSGRKLQIIKTVTPKWREFGHLLNFDPDGLTLDEIEAEKKDPGPCCYEMFQRWRRGGGQQPATWRVLIALLEDAEYNDLAKQIKEILEITLPAPDRLGEKPNISQLWMMKTPSGRKLQIIKTITPKWREFGHLLNFDPDGLTLDEIEAEKKDPAPCCYEMFQRWRRGGGQQPATWAVLMKVLEDVEYNDLAEQIKETLGITLPAPDRLDKRPQLSELKMMKTTSGDVVQIIKTVAPKWSEFGRYLNFDPDGLTVDLIEAEKKLWGPGAYCEEMFQRWLRGEGQQPATWTVLIELLEDAEYNDLAKQIKDALQV